MKYLFVKASYMFVASGLVKVAAGIAVVLWSINDFIPFVYLFGIPALVQGFLHIHAAAHHRKMSDYWWVLLLVGIIYTAAGVMTLSYTDATPAFLMSTIAAAWSFVGVIMVLFSKQLNKEMGNGVELLLTGIISFMAGIYVVTHLRHPIYSILWVVIVYNFLLGMLMILFGFKAKGWRHTYFEDIME